MTTNSSPLSRPTRSPRRTADRIRGASMVSTWSPTRWPWTVNWRFIWPVRCTLNGTVCEHYFECKECERQSGQISRSKWPNSSQRTCHLPCKFTPDGVTTFRAYENRPVRAPPVSRGRRCSTRSITNLRPASAASQRPAPIPRLEQPIGEAAVNETSTEVHAIRPSGLALTCNPGMEPGPSGLNPELRTPPLPATHVRAGTDHRAPARNYATDIISRPSSCEFPRNVRPRVATCGTA